MFTHAFYSEQDTIFKSMNSRRLMELFSNKVDFGLKITVPNNHLQKM